jgi:hypothetical protein
MCPLETGSGSLGIRSINGLNIDYMILGVADPQYASQIYLKSVVPATQVDYATVTHFWYNG